MEANEILKKLREDKGLTMKEVSEATKMATSLISDYETGKKAIGMKVAIRFADYYNVSLDYLMGREPATLPANAMEVLGIEKSVDDDEFMRLYNELPDYAKQIFVNVMAKLARATEQAKPQQKQRHVERLGDIEDARKQEETTQQVTLQPNIQISKRAIARSKGDPFREAPTPEQIASFTLVPEDSDL